MKPCTLCQQPALLFCESDRASLCWDCDAKVHGANFLVARHTRCLLCRACQEPTPWKASGSQLGRTVSVCDSCAHGNCDGSKMKAAVVTAAATAAVVRGAGEVARTAPSAAEVREERGRNSSEDDDDDDLDGDSEDDLREEDEDDEEMSTDYDDEDEMGTDDDAPSEHEPDEDGENQVVPWSTAAVDDAAAAATEPPPPPTASSSSSDDADYYESSSPGRDRAMRRRMMMVRDDDDGFDGAGFAKRRMLARGNRADLAPSYYNYQDDLDGSPPCRSAAGAGDKANSVVPAKVDRKAVPAVDRPAPYQDSPPRQTSNTNSLRRPLTDIAEVGSSKSPFEGSGRSQAESNDGGSDCSLFFCFHVL